MGVSAARGKRKKTTPGKGVRDQNPGEGSITKRLRKKGASKAKKRGKGSYALSTYSDNEELHRAP